ncbi:hypothetical protein KDW_08590 [Dictyobacter vulcani]|uniref:Restriction endonuclease n=1 Tax=Dictyobacter vulcani TaxID=2607529 RepID=A0A5J4KJT0_9CHLR|nr:hypothetical protein [Dictyobacter vulcani]GER86697.1 hypothetical protein KDW_08590 [Dictyobacter vulcani]
MLPRYPDDDARRKAYQNERSQRWSLEEKLLIPISNLICDVIRIESGYSATYQKYAEPLIDNFKNSHPSTQTVPDEIRGAPDLKIQANNREWFVELKIKKMAYHNTRNGSIKVPRYGCESHYLDDTPVYVNLLKHAATYNINLEDIVLLYAVNPGAATTMRTPLAPEEWHLECIKLNDLKRNVESKRYFKYTEGYGQPAWLIRCDDMQGVSQTFI